MQIIEWEFNNAAEQDIAVGQYPLFVLNSEAQVQYARHSLRYMIS